MGFFDWFADPVDKNRKRLKSGKPHERAKGVAGLRTLGWKGIFRYNPEDIRSLGLEGVAQKYMSALEVVLDLIPLANADPDPQVRQETEAAFIELASEALVVNSIQVPQFEHVVEVLRGIPGSAVTGVFLKTLEAGGPSFSDSHPTRAAIEVLGERREQRALPLFQQALKSQHSTIRDRAKVAIKKVEDTYSAIDVLVDQIEKAWAKHENCDDLMRRLRESNDTEAMDRLIKRLFSYLQGESGSTAQHGAALLTELGTAGVVPLRRYSHMTGAKGDMVKRALSALEAQARKTEPGAAADGGRDPGS